MSDTRDAARPRRRWGRWVFVFLALAAIALLAILVSRGPGVPSLAVVVIDLRRPVPERAEEGVAALLAPSPVDLLGLRRVFQAAETDDRVKGVIVRAGAAGMGLAMAEELRAMVLGFRRARNGKFVLGLSEGADGAGYLVLSAADEIVVEPATDLMVLGVSLQSFFLGEALDRLGLRFDILRVGDFKGAYEQLTGRAASPEFEQALEETADSLYQVMVEEIAAGRSLAPAAVRAALDDGPLSPARAVEAKLADRVAYADELPEIAATRAGGVPETISARSYLSAVGEGRGDSRLAFVHVRGMLADTRGPTLPVLGEVSGADEIAGALRRVREDSSLKGLVLRVDSPGGTLSAAERIWREVELTRKVKPVVVSMGGAAASGGYYLSCAADHVVARPATITGSIGVFGGKLVLEKLLDEHGVHEKMATRGRRAGMFAFTRGFIPDERVAFQRLIEDAYRLFLDRVAAGRKKPLEEVERLARGRVWTGRQAHERGLVDELGGIEEAVAVLSRLAHLGAESVALVPVPPRRSLLESLRAPEPGDPLAHGPLARGGLSGALEEAGWEALRLFAAPRTWALDPACLTAR